MKKQILLPVFAILMAAGGAYASKTFSPAFYPANDSDCSEVPIPRPCPKGTDEVCTNLDDQSYYWKEDASDPKSNCEVLMRKTITK